MRMRFVCFLWLTSVFQVNSQTYLIHGFEQDYPENSSYLKIYDFDKDKLLAGYGPIESRMVEPKIFDLKGFDDLLLFTTQKGGKLDIHVLNRETLALKGVIKSKKLTTELDKLNEVNFVRLVNNNKELALVVGSRGKKALVLYDMQTLKEVFRYRIKSRNSLTRLSDDGQFVYFIEQNQFKHNKKLKVVDIKNRVVLPIIPQGEDEAIIYSFQHYLLVSKEVSLSKKSTTKFWQMDFHDLRQGGKTMNESLISSRQQQFEKIEMGQKLLIANRTHKSPYQVKLFELAGQQLTEKKVADFDVKLTQIKYFENSDTLLLLGHKKIASLRLSDGSVKSEVSVSFTAESGMINADGSLAFISTEKGSRMVLIDLKNNRVINELLNNSLIKNVADVLIMASIYYATGMLVIDNSSNDLFMSLNEAESKLFVRNELSNQVSVYEAETFNKRELINAGQDTFAMISSKNNPHPLVVLSKYKAILVNHNDGSVFKTIKYDQFLSFNQSNHLLLIERDNRAELYSSVTGEKLDGTKMQHAKEAFLLVE